MNGATKVVRKSVRKLQKLIKSKARVRTIERQKKRVERRIEVVLRKKGPRKWTLRDVTSSEE